MSEHSYSITGTVNGNPTEWTFDTLDAVMKRCEKLALHREVPETKERITDLKLLFDGTEVTKLGEPYSGLAVP